MNQTEHQKATPQKHATSAHKKKLFEDALVKDLVSPFHDTLLTSSLPSFTPARKQPEYLLSPSPIKKDLFSQLLGTQLRNYSPLKYDNQSIMEEQSASLNSDEFSDESDMEIEEEDLGSENQGNWSEENGIKKRKRKSTAQIKLLKQELDGQMNWTKQKIIKMSKVTGLSQSQVYKWCWDQKKKQMKCREDKQKNYFQRRKIIKKDLGYKTKYKHIEEDNSDLSDNEMSHDIQTKLKASYKLQEDAETQKKVKKRLIFS